MKQEKLLEALGEIDEDLLEIVTSGRSFRGLWRVVILAAVLTALTVTAGALGNRIFRGDSNTMTNTITAQGRFAYSDGYYYFSTASGLYRLRDGAGRPERLPLPAGETEPRFLVMTEQGLGYVTSRDTFAVYTSEGIQEVALPKESHLVRVFAEENYIYTNNGEDFCRIELSSGRKTVLLTEVHGYFVDGDRIYALTEGARFLWSPKDTVAFESVPLSFHPASVIAHGDTLYFTEFLSDGNRYRVIRYRAGEETQLPVVGFNLQIYGEQLLYMDGKTLRSYDLVTGKDTLLAEEVYEYAVVNGDRLCIYHYGGDVTIDNVRFRFYNAG